MVKLVHCRVKRRFNKITNYRFANAEEKIRSAAKQKQWNKAASIINSLKTSNVHPWLESHVLSCASLEHSFNKHVTPKSKAKERLSLINKNYELIKSKAIYGGIINMGLFVHYVKDHKNTKKKIFEKIYVSDRKNWVKLEATLFREIGNEALMAPKLIGVAEEGRFVCVFYEFLEKDSLQKFLLKIPYRRYSMLENIVIKLWASKPTKKLIEEVTLFRPKKFVTAQFILNPEYLNDVASKVESKKAKQVLDDLILNHKYYLETLVSLPQCIMHGDLYNWSNFMVTANKGVFLVDWDKFHISHAGCGIRIKPSGYRNLRLTKKIRAFSAENEAVSEESLWRNVAIDNLITCVRQKEWEEALHWIKKLNPNRPAASDFQPSEKRRASPNTRRD